MKTTYDIVDILWDHISASSLKTAVNGGVYKLQRPVNSKMEDVVINCLPVSAEQLQKGIANVNVFVPDLQVKVNDATSAVPDTKRLSTLATAAEAVLREIWSDDYNISIQQQLSFEDPESGSHYINFRMEFYSINILN